MFRTVTSFAVEIAQPPAWPGFRKHISAVYKLVYRADGADGIEDAL